MVLLSIGLIYYAHYCAGLFLAMAIYLEENWLPVKGFEGIYEVSDCGNVRSLTRLYKSDNFNKVFIGERLTDFKQPRFGYHVVTLYKKPYRKCTRVHRLVAQAFITNPYNLPEVNHIDGDKSNNCLENLEWCTSSENHYHAYATGLQMAVMGSKHGHAKLSEQDVYEIKILLKVRTYSHKFISNIYNISRQGISNIHAGHTWKHIQLQK